VASHGGGDGGGVALDSCHATSTATVVMADCWRAPSSARMHMPTYDSDTCRLGQGCASRRWRDDGADGWADDDDAWRCMTTTTRAMMAGGAF
jgi:hypothetical protein